MGNGTTHYRYKRKKKKDALSIVLIGLFSLVFLFSCLMLVQKLLEYKEGNDKYNAIRDFAVTKPTEKDPYLNVDFDALYGRNSDYIGWLDIPGTQISYPVVRAKDYEEYLHTSFDKTYLYAGTIFADYRCAPDFLGKNTILYGHQMKDGTMFGQLDDYLDEGYVDSHSEINIYRDGYILVYRVFSAFSATAGDSNYTVAFTDNDSYLSWLNNIAARSWYDMGAEFTEDSRVLMLSTCRGGDNTDRTVVFAVLTKTVDR